MKTMKTTMAFLTTFSLLAAANVASADPDLGGVTLGKPSYGGTGCPKGADPDDDSVTAVLSPDKKKLTLIFDAYVAETGPGKVYDRKSCNVAIPLHIPHGVSVSVYRVDHRGFVSVPPGGMGRFAVEYFFPGGAGPVTSRTFLPGFIGDFLLTDEIELPYVVWSECGEDTIARANSNAYVRKKSAYASDEAMLAIDSADITAHVEFHLAWKTCTE